MGVSKNRDPGIPPKNGGFINNGKPYLLMDDLGFFFKKPYFLKHPNSKLSNPNPDRAGHKA